MDNTPLSARQNPVMYTIVLTFIVVVGLFLALYFILRNIKRFHSSTKYIEAQKSQPTTKKNVQALAKKANLTAEEQALLWDICKRTKAKNIEYLVNDEDAISDLFRSEYEQTSFRKNVEAVRGILFSLLFKLEKLRISSFFITSTRGLTEGQEFKFRDSDGVDWTFSLLENNVQGMVLQVPPAFYTSKFRPQALSKILLTFSTRGNLNYALISRLVRYEEYKEGKYAMILSSSNTLKPMQRRMAKRVNTNIECSFSAAKKSQKKKKGTEYDVLEKQHKGILQDISATGCRLACHIPIKQGQYVFVEFSIDGVKTQEGIGIIILTKRASEENTYILHIKFMEMPLSTRNDIYAFTYGYTN